MVTRISNASDMYPTSNSTPPAVGKEFNPLASSNPILTAVSNVSSAEPTHLFGWIPVEPITSGLKATLAASPATTTVKAPPASIDNFYAASAGSNVWSNTATQAAQAVITAAPVRPTAAPATVTPARPTTPAPGRPTAAAPAGPILPAPIINANNVVQANGFTFQMPSKPLWNGVLGWGPQQPITVQPGQWGLPSNRPVSTSPFYYTNELMQRLDAYQNRLTPPRG